MVLDYADGSGDRAAKRMATASVCDDLIHLAILLCCKCVGHCRGHVELLEGACPRIEALIVDVWGNVLDAERRVIRSCARVFPGP